ncbi:tetranectin [Trichomycterus rosablanca]|uniref:tetranectin n=1 Tax=Trichomycterus rosablanca TaxID=2290929 RepID=UPI002F35388D
MAFRCMALFLCVSLWFANSTIEQILQNENKQKDVLLESEAVNSTTIEELRKKIDEIVQELTVLKEVQALHYVCLKGLQIPGKCFLANPMKKTFHTANEDCISKGGTLSTPLTDDENTHLRSYVRQTVGPREHIWLGINDLAKEGEWVDKTGSNISFQNWERDITHQPIGGRTLNCAIMSGMTNGKWFDENCRSERASVCEFIII